MRSLAMPIGPGTSAQSPLTIARYRAEPLHHRQLTASTPTTYGALIPLNWKRLPLYIAVTFLFLAPLAYGSHRNHFRWDILRQQTHYIYWSNILFGVLLIYGQYPVRAVRWVVFL
jgi:hypothetical protein